MKTSADLMKRAWEKGVTIPAFNVSYLPMLKPLVQAVVDQDSFALIEVAQVEWENFEAQGPKAVYEEFQRWQVPTHVRLHLDHVKVADGNGTRLDYMAIINQAIGLGYHSVMVDGSMLSLEENIAATRVAVEAAHAAGIPCEAELGAVIYEGNDPDLTYEKVFASGLGFTNVEDTARYVVETGCDWLSVAVGNIHGAVAGALRQEKKSEARLHLEHLNRLREAAGVPLVLHGGSNIQRDSLLAAFKGGIAKLNVGFEVRQAYESTLRETGNVEAAQEAVHKHASHLIRDWYGLAGTRPIIAE